MDIIYTSFFEAIFRGNKLMTPYCCLVKPSYKPESIDRWEDIKKHEIDISKKALYKKGGVKVLGLSAKRNSIKCMDILFPSVGKNKIRYAVMYDFKTKVLMYLFDFGIKRISEDAQFLIAIDNEGLVRFER